MRLAAVTVTYNEDHLLNSWESYYNIYKEEIDLHVIVDNGSTSDYKKKYIKAFPNSVILERSTNGGVTAGFNAGIKYALSQPDIGYIVLICPDIKFSKYSLSNMKELLMLRKDVGIVGPAILDDENKILFLGAKLSKFLAPRFIKAENLIKIPDELEVDFISGGINMISRNVYETVGFQDEKLFMYGDELDFDLRVKQAGLKLVILTNATCWHKHINLNHSQLRSNLAYFLFSRNTIILYRKYFFGFKRIKGYLVFMYYAFNELLLLIRYRAFSRIFSYLFGTIIGISGLNYIPKNYLK